MQGVFVMGDRCREWLAVMGDEDARRRLCFDTTLLKCVDVLWIVRATMPEHLTIQDHTCLPCLYIFPHENTASWGKVSGRLKDRIKSNGASD